MQELPELLLRLVLKAIDVKDYPRMIQNIPNKEWQNFFKEEAKKLGGAILS